MQQRKKFLFLLGHHWPLSKFQTHPAGLGQTFGNSCCPSCNQQMGMENVRNYKEASLFFPFTVVFGIIFGHFYENSIHASQPYQNEKQGM